MNVTIIGTGYVGLTTGVALAFLDHRVVGVDKDLSKIEQLRNGISPIHEAGMEEMLASASKRLTFTSDTADAVAEADVVVIAVGTPPKDNGAVDVSYVETAARDVAQGLQTGRSYTIVVKSTVPIGTNRRVANVVRQVMHDRGVDAQVFFASNPEFLREGKALHDTLYPDRIVVGATVPEAVEALRRLYEPITTQSFTPPSYLARPSDYRLPPLVTTDATSAEVIKYAANAFLALKISYINEVAGLCDRVGADVSDVAHGIGLDGRIGHRFLGAGIGWGGSCFPKDTIGLINLAAEYGYSMPIVGAARDVNARQRQVVVEKLQQALKVLRGRIVGVLGLSFKPDTDDVRDAPALDIIRQLVELGAHVRVHDPIAEDNARSQLGALDIRYCDDPYAVAEGADAVVLATEWSQYRDLDLNRLAESMTHGVFFDGRNVYEPEVVSAAGLEYLGIGR